MLAVGRIADIYEYAFDEPFAVTSLEGKPRYESQRGSFDAGCGMRQGRYSCSLFWPRHRLFMRVSPHRGDAMFPAGASKKRARH